MIPALANHLWQSTLFAAVAGLLTLALRKNRAQMRYWIWLAASLKFLIPFSLLVGIGSQFAWRAAPAVVPPLSSAIGQITEPFAPLPMPLMATPATPSFSPLISSLLIAVWFCGWAVILFHWYARWRRIRTAMRLASPLPVQAPIVAMSSPTRLEPGVFGIFRPVLLLPEGIADRLTPPQLEVILEHELCHVRRRDNLTATIHMLVEAVFWFHPLVWWIGARMVHERERACDEEVLRLGSEPDIYAAGILNVCKFYLESPLACASGVNGSDLKKRIESIMTRRILPRLTLARKLLLVTVGIAAVAGPVLIGIVNAPPSRAQSKPEALAFEVASVKPADPNARQVSFQLTPGGGLNALNVGLKQLISFAYNIPCGKNCDNLISGAPRWADSQRFDIRAKAPQSDAATSLDKMTADQRKLLQERVRQSLQALLAERFQLALHRETREMPVYALGVAKNGSKLKESAGEGQSSMRGNRGELIAEGVTIQLLAVSLSGMLGRVVLDRTGLNGRYDFKMEWTPEPAGAGLKGPGGAAEKAEEAGASELSGPSIFTALQEQLGLKLESTKGPVEIIVIDRVEKLSEN